MLARSKNLQRRKRRKATVVTDGAIAATLAGQQSRRSISPDGELTAHQRLNQIERYRNLVRAGTNQTNAARQVGFSRSAAFRWIKRYEADGLAGLAPLAHGRRPLARVIRRSKAIPASLRHLVALQPIQFTGLQAGQQIVLIQKGGAKS